VIETALARLLPSDLTGGHLVALMVDWVHFGEHCCVVALSIDIGGAQHHQPSGMDLRRTPLWSPIRSSGCVSAAWMSPARS
jgi:hypothetical protein